MGNELFKEVTDLTGLPKSLISEELVQILGKVGANPHAVTLEDLRKAMATYLTEVIGPEMLAADQSEMFGDEHGSVANGELPEA